MENVFTSAHKIGDIVTKLPRAAEIFKAQGIDFCCGGDRPLSVAILEENLNEDIILAQLNQAYAEAKELKDKGIDWENAGYSQLIDYIIDKHHTYVRKELPRLSDLTAKILKVHWVDNGEVLTKVHKDFHMLKMELEQHLIKEEEILFPMVKDYEKNPSRQLLERILQVNKELEDEHDGAGDLLKSLRKITTNFTVPAGGCNSYILTFKGLEELEWDLFQHIHLENNVLFKRLEDELE